MKKVSIAFILIALNFSLLASAETKVSQPKVTSYEIREIQKNSIYEKLGFKEKDQIVSLNGKSIKDGNDFTKLFEQSKPGTTINIELIREGKKEILKYDIK